MMEQDVENVKGTRREKSEATRRKILRAAEAEFTERGYHGATIASIAKRAGVATQTVYFVFNTKAMLISAAIDVLVMGEDEPTIPQDSDWWRAMAQAPDTAAALRHFVEGAAELFERAGALGEVLRAAALTDLEVRATHEHHEALRATAFREALDVVFLTGPLHPTLTIETATDALLVAFSDSTWVQFRTDRGWSVEQTTRWFAESLPRLLLA